LGDFLHRELAAIGQRDYVKKPSPEQDWSTADIFEGLRRHRRVAHGINYSNSICVGFRECLSKRDRIAVIADLLPGVDFLARLAGARALERVGDAVTDDAKQGRCIVTPGLRS
jgi:hypothetical protein